MATELVTNGAFATDTSWDKGTGWSIADGKADCDGSQVAVSELEQTITSLVRYQTYKIVFTVSDRSAGSVTARVYGGSGTARSENGTFTEYVQALGTGDQAIELRADADFVGKIDNVSVQLAFALVPTWVHPVEPEFDLVVTQAEGMYKQYQLLDSDDVLQYKLIFEGLTDVQFWTLYNHVRLVKGGYDSFNWNSVPDWIDTDLDGVADGTTLTGRWVRETFHFQPRAYHWEAEIVFEKEN